MQLDRIHHPLANKANIQLTMARADLVHPLASGNKYFKLKPNLDYAKANNIKCLLSFGGAFSNHIHALALTAQQEGFESVGIIRGEASYADNPTLTAARKAGMKLVFVSREDYKKRADQDFLEKLQASYPACLIIPEGGSSDLAIEGCKTLANSINNSQAETNEANFDLLAVAAGTGATAAGLICGATDRQTVQVYSALKDASLPRRIEHFTRHCQRSPYQIIPADYGGFAKADKSLFEFILEWLDQTGILLDPVYTSKLCRRLLQQIRAGEFASGTSICIVHSGGLQGWWGMKPKLVKLMGNTCWKQINAKLEDV